MVRRFAWYALAGASAANMALLLVWDVLLQYQSADAYFLAVAPREFVAVLLNVGGAGVLAGSVGVAVERRGNAYVRASARAFALLAALLVANALRQELRLTPNGAGQWIGTLGPRLVLVVAVALLGLVVVLMRRRAAAVVHALVTIAVVTSPFVLVTGTRAVVALTTVDLTERFANRPSVPRLRRLASPAHRVVVLIFDELDYRLAFGARPAGVVLPAFDALVRESTMAEHAESPAPNTNEAMPSLLTGQRVDATSTVDARHARVRLAGTGRWVSTDSMETFMARAHARGANAALVGWNLPYCRTALGDHLAACDWWPSGVLLGRPASLLATMRGQWVASSPLNSRVIQRERHEALLGLALERVADPGLDLVVLHLVPPHYPFIFDAQSGRYTFWSVGPRGYLGNLALADSTLAVLRRAIRRSGLEGVTTLVVTADHAWRTAHEYDGGTDSRVPLIVRLAAHAAADTVRTPVSTLRLGDLVAAALAGDLRDRASLDRWVAANAIASPVAP